MSAVRKLSGVTMAIAAAAVFAATGCANTPASTTASAKGHCNGVNACKGTGACKTASNACKGQNACKGHGWMSMTEGECKTAGGKFILDPTKG
ncbi:MAG: hypothetical protein H7X91_12720 [Burkholderiales bacterium]|nr:hypothetical protein [Burkholderiales bacterium]